MKFEKGDIVRISKIPIMERLNLNGLVGEVMRCDGEIIPGFIAYRLKLTTGREVSVTGCYLERIEK